MPAFYSSSIADFLQLSETELTGLLSLAYARAGFTALKTSQTRTWFADLSSLREALEALVELHSRGKVWTILLEFEIPRKEKRIDVVLLANETIIILELKSSYPGVEAL